MADPNKPGSEGDPDLPADAVIVEPGNPHPLEDAEAIPGAGKPGSAGDPDVPGELEITEPKNGDVVTDPAYAIRGTGAEPGATVELWSNDHHPGTGEPNATTTADDEGNFAFDGGAEAAEGDVVWVVFSDGVVSPPVKITLDSGVSAWSDATSHAAVDDAVPEGTILPDDWSAKTIAAKKTWLDENAS